MGVVDQAFPAHRCARLFKIDPHDQIEGVTDFISQPFQAASIVTGGFGIVNGAWADNDKQAMIFAIQNIAKRGTAFQNGGCGFVVELNFLFELLGSDQHLLADDIHVIKRSRRHFPVPEFSNLATGSPWYGWSEWLVILRHSWSKCNSADRKSTRL